MSTPYEPNSSKWLVQMHREWHEAEDRALENGFTPPKYYKRGKLVNPGPRVAFVYKFWSDDESLYVGKTVSPGTRIFSHSLDKSWFGEITKIEIEKFKSEADALKEEAFYIRALTPKYNTSMPIVEGSRVRPIESKVFQGSNLVRRIRESY